MSENQSSQEKTEQATPKRKEDALKKGDVAQSKDLSSFLIMLIVGLALFIASERIGEAMLDLQKKIYNFDTAITQLSTKQLFNILFSALLDGLLSLALVLFVAFIISILASIILRGKFTFSAESLTFKWDKLDVIKGIKRMFSLNGFVEMLKSVAKFLFILCVAFFAVWIFQDDIYQLSRLDAKVSIYATLHLLAYLFFILMIPLFFIALLDVPYQLWSHAKKLRMTKQEIKDETKHMDGDPQVKGRIRAIQRSMAQRKMLKDVPDANAVIVNPDHYAIAIKYQHGSASIPIVLAKGIDHMAERIKVIAVKNKVVVYREPPLARALYYTTDIGKPIPEGLYLAVAKVLAYIYQIENNLRNSKNQLPEKPTDIEIPEEYQY